MNENRNLEMLVLHLADTIFGNGTNSPLTNMATQSTIKPQRIQLKRVKGFNLQKVSLELNGLEAVKVARPTKYGNRYKVTDDGSPPGLFSRKPQIPIWELVTAEQAVEYFRYDLEQELKNNPSFLDELRGKNLACFCKIEDICHADILLEIANKL